MKTYRKTGIFTSAFLHTTAYIGFLLYALLPLFQRSEPSSEKLLSSTPQITMYFLDSQDYTPPVEIQQNLNHDLEDRLGDTDKDSRKTKLDQEKIYEKLKEMDLPSYQKDALIKHLENAKSMTPDQALKEYERDKKRLEKIPDENVKEITGLASKALGLEDNDYSPRKKEVLRIDSDNSYPSAQIIEKDGKRFYQMLLVDKEGNYLVVDSKLESEMTPEDKRNLKLFQGGNKGINNLIFNIYDRFLEKK